MAANGYFFTRSFAGVTGKRLKNKDAFRGRIPRERYCRQNSKWVVLTMLSPVSP